MSKPYNPNVDWSAFPALTEIIPGLWQGTRPLRYAKWQMVVSCEEHLARKPMEGYPGVVIHLPMRDATGFTIPRRAVEVAVDAVTKMLYGGGDVLVHCTGGLNRSSVVTAGVLIAAGKTPREAVELLRVKRSVLCLCNKEFERWVLKEPLPTAETSVFNA